MSKNSLLTLRALLVVGNKKLFPLRLLSRLDPRTLKPFYLLIALSWELKNAKALISKSPNLASNLGLFGTGDKIPYGLAEPVSKA